MSIILRGKKLAESNAAAAMVVKIATRFERLRLTDEEIVKACTGITIEAARDREDGMTIAMGRAVLRAANAKRSKALAAGSEGDKP